MQADESISPEPWLSELDRRLASPVELADAEGVHQLRIAAGRLGVWLELGGRRALRDDLRRLRRTVARLRDADVLLERFARTTGAHAHERAREEERARAVAGLQAARPEALVRALGYVPRPSRRAAERHLAPIVSRAIRAADALLAGERDPARLHRLRRRVRRTRQALEWLGRDAAFAHELQDALGAWHDATLAAERMAEDGPGGAPTGDGWPEAEIEAHLERACEIYAGQRPCWRDAVAGGGSKWTST